MAKQVITTTKYKKELKRVSQWQNFDNEEFDAVIDKLCKGEQIDKRYRIHPMLNKKLYKGCMNLHLSADILVLYKMTDKELQLTRIGSHSQLLGNEKHNRKGYR